MMKQAKGIKRTQAMRKKVKAKNIIIKSNNSLCCHDVMFKQDFLKVQFLVFM